MADHVPAEPLPVADPATAPDHPDFNAFVQTIAALRTPERGCPWDLKQTHTSIAKNMIEEAYEAVAAIEEGDLEHMREELGDVLLQVVLQAQMAQDAGEFTFDDIARDVNTKIVRRHPHVFGTEAAFAAAGLDPADVAEAVGFAPGETRKPEEVLAMWDQIKIHEKKLKAEARAAKLREAGLDPDVPAGLLDEVSPQQPALMLAQEVSRKTVAVGFEWDTIDDVWDKVDEEIAEFKAAEAGSPEAELEFGDVLFALVNVARKSGIDAETALRHTCAKFTKRWQAMEAAAASQGTTIDAVGTEALEHLWQAAKNQVG